MVEKKEIIKIDKKYIIKLQGKNFVTHEGLLEAFHQHGGEQIYTEKLESSKEIYIFKAVASGSRGNFTAHGDASKSNVNSNIAPHMIRMAETRAINRSLRLYSGIGMCSTDEMVETKEAKPVEEEQIVVENEAPLPDEPKDNYECSECGVEIPPKVASYSKDKFMKPLCMNCQDKARAK